MSQCFMGYAYTKIFLLFIWHSNLTGCPVFYLATLPCRSLAHQFLHLPLILSPPFSPLLALLSYSFPSIQERI